MANPYQTRSFGSTFVLGHEIGHSLGMRHDDYLGCAHCALSLDSLMHPTTIYTVTYQNVTNLLYNMNPLKFLWFFWSRKYRISNKHFSRLSAPNSLFTGSSLKKLFWCLFTSARTRPLFTITRDRTDRTGQLFCKQKQPEFHIYYCWYSPKLYRKRQTHHMFVKFCIL